MRSTQDATIHLTSNGDAIRALTFGYDFAAEQENGLNFWRDFVGTGGKNGAEGRAWTQVPKQFLWVEYKDWAGITYQLYPFNVEQYIRHAFKGDIACAWDDREFLFMVKGEKNIRLMQEFYKKCQDLKVCFFPAKYLDKDSGMCLAITSMMANEFKEIAEEDADKRDVAAAFYKTKANKQLEALLQKFAESRNLGFYPCYMGPSGHKDAKGIYRFWLNDSRVGKPYGYKTDAELCAYLDDLEKEFFPR